MLLPKLLLAFHFLMIFEVVLFPAMEAKYNSECYPGDKQRNWYFSYWFLRISCSSLKITQTGSTGMW